MRTNWWISVILTGCDAGQAPLYEISASGLVARTLYATCDVPDGELRLTPSQQEGKMMETKVFRTILMENPM